MIFSLLIGTLVRGALLTYSKILKTAGTAAGELGDGVALEDRGEAEGEKIAAATPPTALVPTPSDDVSLLP